MKILKSKAFLAFCFGFALYILIILPELISEKGILVFNADFRNQSMPFTFHIRDSILSGNVIWDHSSALGSQFLSSYAFYNLFSPFTAIYLLIPRNAVVYAMPYVFALKYGMGTMLAYFYASRFLKNKNYAVLAGLLYMFSSASAYNLVFHFDDVIAFFPLMLIALEELCTNGRKGVFAITAAFLALLNYYFFIGETVFAVLYFFARGLCDKSFGISIKKCLNVLLEGIIGVMCVMAFLLPIGISLLESNRATAILQPSEMPVYDDIYTYLKIIQSAFMVPDPFGYATMFPTYSTVYPYGTMSSSVAAYLPVFSLTGVISYMVSKRKSWESVLLAVCGVMALVPVLNQLFSALNSSYYARWFFMPMLISAVVTMKALEEETNFKPGVITCAGALAALTVYQIAVDTEDLVVRLQPKGYYNGMINIIHLVISAVSLVLVAVIVKLKRDREYFPKLFIISTAGIYMCFGMICFSSLNDFYDKPDFISRYEIKTEKPSALCTDDRIGLPDNSRNFNLIWRNNSTSFFNSLVNKGYNEFIAANEITKEYSPKAEIRATEHHELDDLISIRYAVYTDPNNKLLSDYKYCADFGNYAVLENPNFIPLGFAYDKMISYDDFMGLEKPEKHRANMKYIITNDFSPFNNILDMEKPEGTMSDEEYGIQVEKRRAESSYSVKLTNDGLISKIALPQKRVVMYSVSYSEGWSAYIDGEKSEVYDVNNGLVGVIVPDGDHEVRLRYTVPGFKAGIIISAAGLIILAGYIVVCRRMASGSADAKNWNNSQSHKISVVLQNAPNACRWKQSKDKQSTPSVDLT